MKANLAAVPGQRLLFWTGMLGMPFAGLAALVPSATPWSLAFIVAGVLLTLADLLLSRRALLPIALQAPSVVRLSVGRRGELCLHLFSAAPKARPLRLGLSLPPQIGAEACERRIEMPADADGVSVSFPLKALKQGRYVLERCYLETDSRLGFWKLRGVRTLQTEIRAYPNLWQERRHLAALFLNRGLGLHRQRQVGKGREFDQLREYLPGDSYEDIHWKATARRRQPITRVYQVERTQQLYVVIDASRLSARPAEAAGAQGHREAAETILDRFITAALVLGMAAQRQGDLFGLLVFDAGMRLFLEARSGALHFNACRDALHTIACRRVSPDFAELFTFVGNRIRRRSLLIFLTSLDDPVLAESFTEHIDIVNRRHLVLVQMLKPLLARPLFSTPAVASTDDLYRQLGGHFLWSSLQETAKVLKRRGVGIGFPESARLCPALVTEYLAVKQRQIL